MHHPVHKQQHGRGRDSIACCVLTDIPPVTPSLVIKEASTASHAPALAALSMLLALLLVLLLVLRKSSSKQLPPLQCSLESASAALRPAAAALAFLSSTCIAPSRVSCPAAAGARKQLRLSGQGTATSRFRIGMLVQLHLPSPGQPGDKQRHSTFQRQITLSNILEPHDPQR